MAEFLLSTKGRSLSQCRMRLSPVLLLILCPLAAGGAARWLRVRGTGPAPPQAAVSAAQRNADAGERLMEKLPLPPLPQVDASIPASQAAAEVEALLAERSAGKIRLRLARLPVPVLFAMVPLLPAEPPQSAQQARLRNLVLETALARDSRGTLEMLDASGAEQLPDDAGLPDALLIESLRDPAWAATLFPNSTSGNKIWNFTRLAGLSPEAAVRYAEALPSPQLQALFESTQSISLLARHAPALVKEKMDALGDSFRTTYAIQEYSAVFFRQDRAAFVAFLSGLSPDDRESLWQRGSDAESGFPGSDPRGLLDLFQQHPDWIKEMSGSSHNLLAATAAALWGTDPDAAVRCMGLMPAAAQKDIWRTVAWEIASSGGGVESALRLAEQAPPALRNTVRENVLSLLAGTDPARAASLLSNDLDENDGVQVMRKWCEKSPGDAAAWWASLPPERKAALRSSWSDVTGMDPTTHSAAEAAAFLNSLNDPELAASQAEEMMESVATSRGEAAAMQWARSLPDPTLREQALAGALERTAARDPARAAEQWSTLPSSDALASRAGNIAAQWALLDPAAAMNWAASLRGAARKEAVQRALMAAADGNPESVAEVLPAWTADAGVDGDEITTYVAQRWATADAAGAAQWAQALPPGPQRDATLRLVLKEWATDNPVGAAAALETMAPGKVQDEAIGEVADALPLTECVSWLCRISDPLVRREKLQLELRSEFMSHRAEVRSMLDPAAQNAIPEADRAILRTILPVDP